MPGSIFCILFVFSPNAYLTPELQLPDRYMDAESGFPPDPRSDEAAHRETTSASVAIDYKALPCSCQLINNVATPCSSDCKGLQRPSLATREDKRPPIGGWDHHHIHEYCQQHPITNQSGSTRALLGNQLGRDICNGPEFGIRGKWWMAETGERFCQTNSIKFGQIFGEKKSR